MNIKRFSIFLSSALALGALSTVASDALATDPVDLEVTADIVANCTIQATPIQFGNYDPIVVNLASPLDSTGAVTVTCTKGASAKIKLGQGENVGAGSTDAAPVRRMTDETNFLSYSLSSVAPGGTEWGNTDITGVSHTGDGSETELTVHGRVAAGQNVPIGSYADTVVATVTF
ncbi:MAG: protein U [Deltaproteobacteria bacterium HGW-Deltaproteobacteria-20]|jgi:spore coat protein U-like protein|nr:MAG: protein U [Deltaproteobacteria bacterium HGW-Deltaproteobacteria-20]